MTVDFYRAFEDRFRGSRDLIKSRLEAYLPFIRPLQHQGRELHALDLGCGRGEWLEILGAEGVSALGVDMDAGMLEACHESGLNVILGDATKTLQEATDNSYDIVSAFHVVEHLDFNLLQQWITEALRILKPGGVLVLETPNPENVLVGSSSFYLDPSHIKPLPPKLLAFMPEWLGFARVHVIGLNQLDVAKTKRFGLYDSIAGVSLDYGVVAQKGGNESLLHSLDQAFASQSMLGFHDLASLYDQAGAQDIANVRSELSAQAQQICALSQRFDVADRRAMEAEKTILSIYESNSWKITKPLRWVGLQIRLLKSEGLGARLLAFAKKITRKLGIYGQAARVYGVLSGKSLFLGPKTTPKLKTDTGDVGFNPIVLPTEPLVPESLLLEELIEPSDDNVWIRIVGHIEGHFSLAIVNRALAVALEELFPGRVIFEPYNDGLINDPVDIPIEQRDLINHQLKRRLPVGEAIKVVSIAHHYPIIVDPLPADVRLVIFFWEETSVPSAAVDKLNKNFDVILVAASFVKRALRNSGCRKPIIVIPLGLDHLLLESRKSVKKLESKQNPFRFLHVSSFFPRKGPDVLLEAFFGAFNGNDNVELYVKTFANPHNEVHALLAGLKNSHSNPPRVIVDENPLSTEEMLDLYETADTVVLPARGEGFNLPAAESLALNIPVVVTGAAAQLDFATQSTATLIPYRYAYSSSHVQSDASCWFEPDSSVLSHLMQAMKAQVESSDQEILRNTKLGREFVTKNYKWSRAAQSIRQILKRDWFKKQLSKPKLAVISSWGCRCGIAEYTKNLLSEAGKEFTISIFCDDRSKIDELEPNASITWKIGDQSIEQIFQTGKFTDYNVVLIQHQPSLFRLTEKFCAQLEQLIDSGKIVVLELHSTKPLVNDDRPTPKSIRALRKLSRVIVHNVDSLNHLLSIGLADNVFLLPHGVINKSNLAPDHTARDTLGLSEGDLLIGSFGFALPHKGVDQIIEAIKPLERQLGCRVGFLAVNSVLDDRSSQTIQSWKKLAETLGVSDRISWITDYRPIDQCINLLCATDFVVYPYRDTQESASGAVTIGLSSSKPVLVSDSPIFAELKGCCYPMTGARWPDIVAAVSNLMKRKANGEEIQGLQKLWLEQRSWEAISNRLTNSLLGLIDDGCLANGHKTNQAISNKRFFVDVSELYRKDAMTGIQRVVHSILDALMKAPPAGFDVYPVFSETGKTYCYTAKFTRLNTRMILWDQQEITFNDGDVFLGLDLTAHLFPQVESLLQDFRSAGVQIAYVLYDILPVTHPEYFPAGMSEPFIKWMHGLSRHADQVLAISNYSASQLRSWLNDNAPESKLEVTHFHLGSDFIPNNVNINVSDECIRLQSSLDNHFTFIAVGTIEPRKGYSEILDALESIWESDSDANLIIVGKIGWKTEDLVKRIRQHPMLGKRLHWFDSATDQFLEYCYSKSDCLIAASFEEGFGLPIVEALRRGVPVVARDIPVFKEVGHGLGVTYFSGDQSSLVQALNEARTCKKQPIKDSSALLSWGDSKEAIIRNLGLKT